MPVAVLPHHQDPGNRSLHVLSRTDSSPAGCLSKMMGHGTYLSAGTLNKQLGWHMWSGGQGKMRRRRRRRIIARGKLIFCHSHPRWFVGGASSQGGVCHCPSLSALLPSCVNDTLTYICMDCGHIPENLPSPPFPSPAGNKFCT